ncbi:MAG TPA: helix-turn-helix domain-containing protein [Flavisolibacter sp.]|nr:helix-turn-helix domain-containing protein [Flavisolibacter sp.]
MFHQIFVPHPELKEIVNNIMISEVSFDGLKPAPRFMFPPLPEQCLFFYPYDCMEVEYVPNKSEKLSSAVIVGPQTTPVYFTMGHHHLVIKVGFQPGGLYRLLGIPMYNLLQTEAINARDLLGKETESMNDQLRSAQSYQEMRHCVEMFLRKKLYKIKQQLPIDKVLPLLIREGGLLPIEGLADKACLSNRQFERVFKTRIGLSPKYFSRIVRFANAWVAKEADPKTTWIEIAHSCGYYDQMHLIRDFKEFTQTNPSEIETALRSSSFSLKNKVFH